MVDVFLGPALTNAKDVPLVGLPLAITGQAYQDLPVRVVPRAVDLLTWLSGDLLNTLLAPVITAPFIQSDWPNPVQLRPAGITNRTWLESYNLTLIGQDALPFYQTDWPVPGRYTPLNRGWADSYKLTLIGQDQLPFVQSDWPVPKGYAPSLLRVWSDSYKLTLIGQDVLPARQSDWPVPGRYAPTLLRGTTDSYKLTLIGQDALPFVQLDWPVPKGYQPSLLRTWTDAYKLTLIGQDALAFRQGDWPNPRTPASLREAAVVNPLVTALALAAMPVPLDWPNPLTYRAAVAQIALRAQSDNPSNIDTLSDPILYLGQSVM